MLLQDGAAARPHRSCPALLQTRIHHEGYRAQQSRRKRRCKQLARSGSMPRRATRTRTQHRCPV